MAVRLVESRPAASAPPSQPCDHHLPLPPLLLYKRQSWSRSVCFFFSSALLLLLTSFHDFERKTFINRKTTCFLTTLPSSLASALFLLSCLNTVPFLTSTASLPSSDLALAHFSPRRLRFSPSPDAQEHPPRHPAPDLPSGYGHPQPQDR